MGWLNNLARDNRLKVIMDAIYNNGEGYGSFGEWWNGYSVPEEEQVRFNQIKDLINKYGLTESQVRDIIKNSYMADDTVFGNGVDISALVLQDLQELESWNDYIGNAPTIPKAEDFYAQAVADIDKENAELSAIYDSIFKDEKEGLSRIMEDNNAMFNDYRNQTLTNNAMSQQAIAGSTRFELERQQRTAISRGASAAQRLVANINTSLGLQAQSAQQALETSNALAQNLLAHRQANENVRSSYMNAQKEDSLRRADLIKGRTERINANKDSYLNTAMNAYDVENTAYNDRLSKTQGTNPWSGAWTSWYTKQNSQKDNKNVI